MYPVFNKSNPVIELLGQCFCFSKLFLYLAHDVHIISCSLLPACIITKTVFLFVIQLTKLNSCFEVIVDVQVHNNKLLQSVRG